MNQQVSLDDAFGTIRMHVSTQSAIGEHKPKPIGLLAGTLRVMGMIIRSRLDGSYKQNPFFIPGTGDSFVTPKVLNQDLKGSSIQ
jgi:hypothetical protein